MCVCVYVYRFILCAIAYKQNFNTAQLISKQKATYCFVWRQIEKEEEEEHSKREWMRYAEDDAEAWKLKNGIYEK